MREYAKILAASVIEDVVRVERENDRKRGRRRSRRSWRIVERNVYV